MKTYEDFVRHAPRGFPTSAEHDAWFRENGYEIEDLHRVTAEVASTRVADIPDGKELTADEIVKMLRICILFGFELGVRCETEEGAA